MKILKTIILFVSIFYSQMSSANYYFGDGQNAPYLGFDGYCHFDWYRPPNLSKYKSILENGGEIKLQSRYQWTGIGSIPYVPQKTGEHAILAFTQGTIEGSLACPRKGNYESLLNSSRHPIRQALHRYGVGALITPKGLGIEFWNGDGTAYGWNQYDNNRCATHVPSGASAGMCLSANKNSDSYLTNNPGFTIQKGAYYWLRITLRGNPNGAVGWTRLHAELLIQTATDAILIQEGQVNFITNQYLPLSTPIEASIGRTGAEYPESNYDLENILFWAFDGGF